jgi:hypothetical protein
MLKPFASQHLILKVTTVTDIMDTNRGATWDQAFATFYDVGSSDVELHKRISWQLLC